MAILTVFCLMNSVQDIEFEKMVNYIKDDMYQAKGAQQKIRT